jgi:hypothetical protein
MCRLVELVEQVRAEPLSADVATEPDLQRALFEEMGRVQWREGREVRTLLTAYQEGARVAWRHLSRLAVQEGVTPARMAVLAEAVLLLVDQLSAASVEGYLQQQSEAAATRERLRQELADLLLSDRSDSAVVHTAAARAGWRLPRAAAVVLVDPAEPAAATVIARLEQSCLVLRRQRMLGAIVPDPPEQSGREQLAQRLRGAGAVVGPVVPVRDLPASLHVAELTATLRRSGVLDGDPVFVDEHLDALIVWRDPALLEALRRQCLAPLEGLPAGTRHRLEETLRAWLRHLGDRRAVAEELHVHPQTVRYRMGQLQQHFGGALDDPQARSRLLLALAWSRPSPV